MPIIPNPKLEAYAQGLADGKKQVHAYTDAGYAPSRSGPSALAKDPRVTARVLELIALQTSNRRHIEHLAVERAADRLSITKEKVLAELAAIGFANMLDYMRVGPDGDAVLDFSKLTRDHGAALVEVTVEDFKDGRGEDARDVRRVKFKLADKRAALVDIGKELGMFIDRKHLDVSVEQRIAMMTDEQRLDEAKKLADRIRARLALEAPELIEGEAHEVAPDTPSDEPESGK